MANQKEDCKEMCKDLFLEIDKLNKIDLFYRTIHDANEAGSINEKETYALYKGLKKIAHVCGIGILIPKPPYSNK